MTESFTFEGSSIPELQNYFYKFFENFVQPDQNGEIITPEEVINPKVFIPTQEMLSEMQARGLFDIYDDEGNYVKTVEVRQLKFMPMKAFVVLGHRILLTIPTLSDKTNPGGPSPDATYLDDEEIEILNTMISGMIKLTAYMGYAFASDEWNHVQVNPGANYTEGLQRTVTSIIPMPDFVNFPTLKQAGSLSDYLVNEFIAALMVIWPNNININEVASEGKSMVGVDLTWATTAASAAANKLKSFFINRIAQSRGIPKGANFSHNSIWDLVNDPDNGLIAKAVPVTKLSSDTIEAIRSAWPERIINLIPHDTNYRGGEG